jgi:hypothetical protein
MKTLWKLRRVHVVLALLSLLTASVCGALLLALAFDVKTLLGLGFTLLVGVPAVAVLTLVFAGMVVGTARVAVFDEGGRRHRARDGYSPDTGAAYHGGVDHFGNTVGSRRDY